MAFGYDGVNYVTQATMSGAQLDAFFTTPFQLIAAPGANLVIMIQRIETIFVQTGSNIYGQDSGVVMCWNNTAMSDPPDTNGINPNSTTVGHPMYSVWDAWGRLAIANFDLFDGINQPIKVQANFDWNTVGEPLTTHLSNPGTLYNPGDTSNPGGSGSFQITVDTVTGGPPGPIATYHISHAELPGVGFPAGAVLDIADAGSEDAVLVVDTIQPGTSGAFHFTIEYRILSAV